MHPQEKKICNYLDIPLQHISEKILKSMRRGGSKEKTNSLINKIRTKVSGIAIRTTLIVGYPGETEEDFQSTVDLIKKVNFINSYSFIFSPRPGTKAEGLDLIDKKISMKRLESIQNLLSENQTQMNKKIENSTTRGNGEKKRSFI